MWFMNFDFLGCEYGLTVLRGEAPVYEWEFKRGDVLMDVSGVTFAGRVDGVGDVVVEHVTGEVGVLRVCFPRMSEVGEFGFELWYVTELGERGRLVFGQLGVVESSVLLSELKDLEVEQRRMVLRMPRLAGGHVQLTWKAGVGTAAAVEDAIVAAREAVGAAGQAMEALSAATAFIASFNEAVRSAVRVDDDGVLVIGDYYTGIKVKGEDGVTPHIGRNGNWWVGARDLGKPSRGEDGLTPSISADGFWVLGDWKSPVRAAGRDGINGTAVRRILVDSVAELPQEGERCNGGFYYYVPNAEGEYDVYAWLERRDSAGWVRVTQAYDIATDEVYGLSKLGTNIVASEGAPVAVNAAGGMVVPVATTVDYGSMRASSSVIEKFGGGGIYVQDGKAWVNMATTNSPGVVIYSAWGATPDNYCIGPNTSGWIDVMDAAPKQKGVVYLTTDFWDEREQAVASVTTVRNFVVNNYFQKSETWDREQVKGYVSEQLAGYCLAEDALSKEDLREALSGWSVEGALGEAMQYVDEKLKGYVSAEEAKRDFMKGKGASAIEVVPLDELPAPAYQAKGVLYVTFM
jgi:hypothetical protein